MTPPQLITTDAPFCFCFMRGLCVCVPEFVCGAGKNIIFNLFFSFFAPVNVATLFSFQTQINKYTKAEIKGRTMSTQYLVLSHQACFTFRESNRQGRQRSLRSSRICHYHHLTFRKVVFPLQTATTAAGRMKTHRSTAVVRKVKALSSLQFSSQGNSFIAEGNSLKLNI